jgi:hypothetical protein
MSFRDRLHKKNQSVVQHFASSGYQTEMRGWLSQYEWSHFVTITFNEAIRNTSARRLLSRFHQRLDSKLFGRRFFNRPDTARTFFIALPEVASSLHFHAMFRVPVEVCDRFVGESPAILKSIAKAASYDIQPIQSSEDKDSIISYITKDAYKSLSIENFIVSSEFNRRRATATPTDSPASEFASSIR